MDLLQMAIENDEYFYFMCGNFTFLGRNEYGYYRVMYMETDNDDFEVQFKRSFKDVKEYVNSYFDYEYCELMFQKWMLQELTKINKGVES